MCENCAKRCAEADDLEEEFAAYADAEAAAAYEAEGEHVL